MRGRWDRAGAEADEPLEKKGTVRGVWPAHSVAHSLGVELHGKKREGFVFERFRNPDFRPGREVQTVSKPVHGLVVGAVGGKDWPVKAAEQGVFLCPQRVDSVHICAGRPTVEQVPLRSEVLEQGTA